MRLILFAVAGAAALAGCDRAPTDRATNAEQAQSAATAAEPSRMAASFDCAAARGQAQELVCADANLAAMDREVARLAGLAAEPAAQAEWAQQRDSCGKADLLRECVMSTSALAIHRLRSGSEAARAKDGEGISVGPVGYRCKGIADRVQVTFVNSDPGAVAIEWGKQALALDHVTAASGAKYEGRWDGRPWTFWTKGREGTLTDPARGDLPCAETAPAG
jgi:membrane-bound inhibitor of C-type lysozyme